MKELLNKINNLIASVTSFNQQLEEKDDKIKQLELNIVAKEELLIDANKKITLLEEELENLDFTELNEAIAKLEEVING